MLSRGRFAVKVVVFGGAFGQLFFTGIKSNFCTLQGLLLILLLLLLLSSSSSSFLRVRLLLRVLLLLLLLLLRVVLGLVLVRVTCSGPSIHLRTLLGPAWACLGPMLGLCLCWHLFALC